MRIAILGWGSLLWEGGAEFDKWRTDWEYDGPILKIEFSRLSKRRLRALTLVIDDEHGAPTTVAWCLSKRARFEDAVCDLRSREDTTTDQIGSVMIPPKGTPSKNASAQRPIEAWARAKKLDAVIWTALGSNFKEKTKNAFSVATAIEHLQSLSPEAKVKAAEYIWRAPDFVRTPLRAAIQVEPWFKSAVPGQSTSTKPLLEVSDKIAIAVGLLTAIVLFFEDKTPAVVASLLTVGFACGRVGHRSSPWKLGVPHPCGFQGAGFLFPSPCSLYPFVFFLLRPFHSNLSANS